jgi:hypothetical protein
MLYLLLFIHIIYSYRIERAVETVTLKNNNVNHENFIFKGIICAVDIHRQAMKLVNT